MTAAAAHLDRRTVLLGASASAVLAGMIARWTPAAAQTPPQSTNAAPAIGDNGWQALVERIRGESKPTDIKLLVELPEIAENGNTVPFTIGIESPMIPADHVRAVHLISTANPVPLIASFQFTLLAGRPVVTGRMRLAHTQEIVVAAEFGNGAFALTRREVKVTIGGCGG